MSKWLSLGSDIGELLLSIRLAMARHIDDRISSTSCADIQQIAQNIDTLCLFIGYPRSGHSLVGSLIDAHPQALIAHRLGALTFVQKGVPEESLYYLMYKNSRRFAKNGRNLTRYSYRVPNHWQGRFETLKIIGDQDSKWTVRKMAEDLTLIPTLANYKARVKLIHVVRNPFDNISTMAQRSYSTIDFNIKRYFYLCQCVKHVKQQTDHLEQFTILDVKYEDVLTNPVSSLRDIIRFLGLSPTEQYLNDCANIVYQAPHQTRYKRKWSQTQKNKVTKKIADYPFLKDYQYD